MARWRARALPVEARGTPEGRMRDHGCRLVLDWDSGASSRQITRLGASVGWSVEEIS